MPDIDTYKEWLYREDGDTNWIVDHTSDTLTEPAEEVKRMIENLDPGEYEALSRTRRNDNDELMNESGPVPFTVEEEGGQILAHDNMDMASAGTDLRDRDPTVIPSTGDTWTIQNSSTEPIEEQGDGTAASSGNPVYQMDVGQTNFRVEHDHLGGWGTAAFVGFCGRERDGENRNERIYAVIIDGEAEIRYRDENNDHFGIASEPTSLDQVDPRKYYVQRDINNNMEFGWIDANGDDQVLVTANDVQIYSDYTHAILEEYGNQDGVADWKVVTL